MDISTLAPALANLLGLQPSTLVLLILIITTAARAIGRIIPDDATGAMAVLRRICSVIGVDVSSRITSGVSMADISRAAYKTPPIPAKVAADADLANKPGPQ